MFFVNWERVPRVPPALPRCRAWGDLHHQFEEQGKHSINQCMLFDENYGLASTQSLKNKDISEGGAEGDYFAFIEGGSAGVKRKLGASPRLCFEKHVDVRVFLFPLGILIMRTNTVKYKAVCPRAVEAGVEGKGGDQGTDGGWVHHLSPLLVFADKEGFLDSDLGWNEILLSSDKTVAIIDGSGVLADAAGLDCAELLRLAKLRVPVSHFDKS
ncbi:hypothetical protein B0H19DRAFT_1244607 [Mycena capillaripes]|nr:hypothetical protein B0H19DRAFT_1244607 [Mycena capillaripes]